MIMMHKILVVVGLAVSGLSVLWPVYLDCYFYAYSPRIPDACEGLIYMTTVHHGTIVYLNAKQWRWFSPTAQDIYIAVGSLAFFLTALLAWKWKIRR